MDFLQFDEIATLLSLPQAPPGVIFIEVRRGDRPWLFSLDEYDDKKFYKSILLQMNNTAAASPIAVQIYQSLPYLSF